MKLYSYFSVLLFVVEVIASEEVCHAQMMLQGPSRHCTLLAVLCGKSGEKKQKQKQDGSEDQPQYPFPEIASSSHLEVIIENFRFCTPFFFFLFLGKNFLWKASVHVLG